MRRKRPTLAAAAVRHEAELRPKFSSGTDRGTIAGKNGCRRVFRWRLQMAISEIGEKEFGNLIGSDKVEGTAVYGADDNKIGSIERVMIDKVERKGFLRGSRLRRIPRSRQRSLPATLAVAKIRHEARRLCGRSYRKPASRRAEVWRRSRLGLGRCSPEPVARRLLRNTRRLKSGNRRMSASHGPPARGFAGYTGRLDHPDHQGRQRGGILSGSDGTRRLCAGGNETLGRDPELSPATKQD